VTEALSPALRAWVEAEVGSGVVTAEPIGRGASRRIWGIALESGEELVVREDTGDGPVAGTPLTLSREADAYRALATTDLPVPSLRAARSDGTALLVERAAGDDQLKGVTAPELRSVAEDYGRWLGRLHLLEPDTLALGSIAPRPGAAPTADDLHLWRAIDAARVDGASSPAARLALGHLAGTVPPSTREALCHGDAGPGNFLHAAGRVTALLDWEFTHVGDPHDDLAWVAVRNQVLGHPFPVGPAYAAWRETTAMPIELPRLEWFRALVLTRMLISCDAAIAWAGADAPRARVQAVLRPFLSAAVFEALRRAGGSDPATADPERDARAIWEGSPVAGLLDDPACLDDLGALL
jgi:aminoglycoside phosphotransferase (APT) family kinase protein